MLGSGAFAAVYKAELRVRIGADNSDEFALTHVAVKILHEDMSALYRWVFQKQSLDNNRNVFGSIEPIPFHEPSICRNRFV